MPRTIYTSLHSIVEQDADGYTSDISEYDLSDGRVLTRGELLGRGYSCIVHALKTMAGEPSEIVVCRPRFSGLIRMRKNPLTLSRQQLDEIFQYRTGYALYEYALYALDDNTDLIRLSYEQFKMIDDLFPAQKDVLVDGSMQRLKMLAQCTYADKFTHFDYSFNDNSLEARLKFNQELHPDKPVVLYNKDENDFRLLIPKAQGFSFENCHLSDSLEQITVFISSVEAFTRLHRVCILLKLSEMPDLTTFTFEVPCYLAINPRGSHTSDYFYINNQYKLIHLDAINPEALLPLFPSLYSNTVDATKEQLKAISTQTGHRHRGRVILDVKADNIFINNDFCCELVDGGDSILEGEVLSETFHRCTEDEVIAIRRMGTWIAPEAYSTLPVKADRSMDIYPLGYLMESICVNPTPELKAIIDQCKSLDPAQRPSLRQLKTSLEALKYIYKIRQDIKYHRVDFNACQSIEEIYQLSFVILQSITALTSDSHLPLAMLRTKLDLYSSQICSMAFSKMEEIEVASSARAHTLQCLKASVNNGFFMNNADINGNPNKDEGGNAIKIRHENNTLQICLN